MAVKIVELVGASTENFGEAVEEALERTAKTVRNISGLDVLGFSAKVENGKIIEYRANVKIAFKVEE
ncbi:dodecin domain-containing protein [Nanoarchaeota archaeon]|nr:MAG: dodecin domain-containing protein [Nanoarchaeota archaeon]